MLIKLNQMSKKLNKTQLGALQGLQEEFNNAKTEIADCEIKKASLMVSKCTYITNPERTGLTGCG